MPRCAGHRLVSQEHRPNIMLARHSLLAQGLPCLRSSVARLSPAFNRACDITNYLNRAESSVRSSIEIKLNPVTFLKPAGEPTKSLTFKLMMEGCRDDAVWEYIKGGLLSLFRP